MEKEIAKKYPENWSDAKIVKKYIVPLLREQIDFNVYTGVGTANKKDVKFYYVAVVEYKRKFYGGESTKP